MPGMNLGLGGQLRFGGAGGTIAAAPTASMTQAAYGGGSANTTDSGVQTWHVGVAVPVAAVVFLMFIRWTLPG